MVSKKTKRTKATRKKSAKRTPTRKRVTPKPKKSTKSPKSKKSAGKGRPKQKQAPKSRAPKQKPQALPSPRPSPVIAERREYESVLNAAAQSFPETRYFTSANSLMGYLEGRPGVVSLLTVIPSRGGERLSGGWSEERRREMEERLDASPPAQDAAERPEFRAWRRSMLEALEWADDGGVVAEVEVESDSEPGES